MKRFSVWLGFAQFSLFVNSTILVSVVLNLDWVRTRAAGGQFDNFPLALRIIYFLMFIFMISIMIWLWDNRKGSLTQRGTKFAKFLWVLFSISTLTQLISRSADERWNALPAVILAITFFKLAKQK